MSGMLFFDGKQLNDDCTLAECHIKNGPPLIFSLDLLLATWSGLMQIFILFDENKLYDHDILADQDARKGNNYGSRKLSHHQYWQLESQDTKGEELDYCRKIAEYNIHSSSVHDLLGDRCDSHHEVTAVESDGDGGFHMAVGSSSEKVYKGLDVL
ncbi:hypothetical protein Tco_1011553 [Tanacetum coccineum]